MNKDQQYRLEYLINGLKKIEGQNNKDVIIDKDTKLRGTTLEKLSLYNGPAFNRVSSWIKEKLDEIGTPNQPTETTLFRNKMQECFDLFKSRNNKYGDSWKVLSLQSVANLIEMKMHRVANMSTQQIDPKIKDEFQDSVNYAVMGLLKLKEIYDKSHDNKLH